MTHQTWTHWKIALLAAATALLTSLITLGLKGGMAPAQFLSWTFSTFILTYPALLGTAGRPCRLRAGRTPK